MKKKNSRQKKLKQLKDRIIQAITRDIIKSLIILVAFICFFLLFIFSRETGTFKRYSISDFKVGEPASADVVVDRDVSYTDEEATRLKKEAEAMLIPPVFMVESQLSRRAFDNYNTFALNFPILLRQHRFR